MAQKRQPESVTMAKKALRGSSNHGAKGAAREHDHGQVLALRGSVIMMRSRATSSESVIMACKRRSEDRVVMARGQGHPSQRASSSLPPILCQTKSRDPTSQTRTSQHHPRSRVAGEATNHGETETIQNNQEHWSDQ